MAGRRGQGNQSRRPAGRGAGSGSRSPPSPPAAAAGASPWLPGEVAHGLPKSTFVRPDRLIAAISEHIAEEPAQFVSLPGCPNGNRAPLPGMIVMFLGFLQAGLLPPFSDFFLQLLEEYGINHVHLSPNSVLLVAVFVHLCEMFVGVMPSVRLFRHLFVLRWGGPTQVVGCVSFRRRENVVFPSLNLLSKVEAWQEKWFFMEAKTDGAVPRRLRYPSGRPTKAADVWEQPPAMEPEFAPVLERIRLLVEDIGLDGGMIAGDFISRRLAPLQKRTRAAWWYTGEDDVTRFKRGQGTSPFAPAVRNHVSKILKLSAGADFMPPAGVALAGNPQRDEILRLMPKCDARGLVPVGPDARPGALRIPGSGASVGGSAGRLQPSGAGQSSRDPSAAGLKGKGARTASRSKARGQVILSSSSSPSSSSSSSASDAGFDPLHSYTANTASDSPEGPAISSGEVSGIVREVPPAKRVCPESAPAGVPDTSSVPVGSGLFSQRGRWARQPPSSR